LVLAAAERLHIPVMMNVPTVLPEVGQVAARHPNLRIIIDHMGRLRGMKDATLRLDKTIALAKYPNVHVKLTLISECTSAEYPYKNIQPEVRRLIDAFSPRRSFWGTDLSVMLSRSTLHVPAGCHAVHGGDGIFEGRTGMDHGEGSGRVPALADQVILPARPR
jgi:predicted TIM-barrel fold metal-dependent hydrolase